MVINPAEHLQSRLAKLHRPPQQLELFPDVELGPKPSPIHRRTSTRFADNTALPEIFPDDDVPF
jgi:hypothetical protein